MFLARIEALVAGLSLVATLPVALWWVQCDNKGNTQECSCGENKKGVTVIPIHIKHPSNEDRADHTKDSTDSHHEAHDRAEILASKVIGQEGKPYGDRSTHTNAPK